MTSEKNEGTDTPLRGVPRPIVQYYYPGSLEDKLAFFFRPPEVEPELDYRTYSILQLLRREVQECMFDDIVAEADAIKRPTGTERRHFASAILCATGLDLLAKFHDGSDDRNRSKARFVQFAQEHVPNGAAPLNSDEADALYWARCSLVHSFTTFHRQASIAITVSNPRGKVIESVAGRWLVGIRELFAAFVASIASYEAQVRADVERQKSFETIYRTYGQLLIVPGQEGQAPRS